MIACYQTVLAARIVYRDEVLCLLSYDDKDHRLTPISSTVEQKPAPARAPLPSTAPAVPKTEEALRLRRSFSVTSGVRGGARDCKPWLQLDARLAG